MKPKIVTIKAQETDQIAFDLKVFEKGLIQLSEEIGLSDLVIVEIETKSGTILCPTATAHHLKLSDGTFVYLLNRLTDAKTA